MLFTAVADAPGHTGSRVLAWRAVHSDHPRRKGDRVAYYAL